jgi:predicted naringenin-chalcone synthase
VTEDVSDGSPIPSPAGFERSISVALRRYGCSDGQIANRGHELADFGLKHFNDMRVFRLHENPSGHPLNSRMDFYAERCDEVLSEIYPQTMTPESAPDLMIHVSCTGYVSPNPTQRLISLRGWSSHTTSTQAYHMGCYAAVPAMRQAMAHVLAGLSKNTDIVHNELCTLHFDPSRHEPEQLVVQSLFADGHIAYRVNATPGNFRILALGEEIIPDSVNEMTWKLAPNAFQMTLGRAVPQLIANRVLSFVTKLYDSAGLSFEADRHRTHAALHPGGPRIIEALKDTLKLDESAVTDSRAVLREMGNMSSATLPHILQRIADNPSVPLGTPVLGLAFGPGLSMVGILAEKTDPRA